MSVRRSLAWSYSGQALNFLIAFGSSIVIARLVTPREFGIFAMASALGALLGLVFNFGLAKYIVREEEVDRETLRSVFTVSAVFTIVFALLLLGSGWAAVHLFGSPQVGEFLLVFGFSPLIQIFEFIPQALGTRLMRFGTITAISVLRAAILAAVTIVLAWGGYQHMSFAWAGIAATLVSAIAYNLLFWKQTVFRPRFVDFAKITTFGLQMVSISGFAQVNGRLGEMVLGSWLGLGALGLYSRASNLANQLYNNVYGVATSVIFVKMAADYRDSGEFHQTFLRALRMLLAIVWPMMLGLAVLSQPVIFTLYGEQWLGAALPLTYLMLAFFVVLGIGMHWEVFILRKETALQTRIEAIRAVSGISLFAAACLVSLPLAAAARLAESIIAYLLYRPYMDRMIGTTRGQLDRLYLECLAVAGLAVAPSLALMAWTRFDPRTPILWVGAAVALGILAWTFALVRLRHPILEELQRLRQHVRPGKTAAVER